MSRGGDGALAVRVGHKFAGSVAKPRLVLTPDDLKTCSRCGEARPARLYTRDSRSVDGLGSHCKFCKAANAKARRLAKTQAKHSERWRGWTRPAKDVLIEELLDALRDAASRGAWHGRDGLRAYANARRLLARFEEEPVAEEPDRAPADERLPANLGAWEGR